MSRTCPGHVKLSYSTALKWMHAMGFKRDTAKKCYYVDGHEKPEQQKHRSKFLDEYLTRIEPRCHRWGQISNVELNDLKEKMKENKLLNTGYCFKCGEEDMIEFHVDDHDYLQAYEDKKYPDFGGSVSIRTPPGVKPVIFLDKMKLFITKI